MTAKQYALKDITQECKKGFFKKNYLYQENLFQNKKEYEPIIVRI